MFDLFRKTEIPPQRPNPELTKVAVANGKMAFDDREYRIRELEAISLLHLRRGDWNTVNVILETTDHSGKNAFSQCALKREQIGTIKANSVIAQTIRKLAAGLDIPVLEY